MHPTTEPTPIWPCEVFPLPPKSKDDDPLYITSSILPLYNQAEQHPTHARAKIPGLLHVPSKPTKKNPIRIENNTAKRYIPKTGDSVIGLVQLGIKEGFRVDINAPTEARLGEDGFEYASRRVRPKWNVRRSCT